MKRFAICGIFLLLFIGVSAQERGDKKIFGPLWVKEEVKTDTLKTKDGLFAIAVSDINSTEGLIPLDSVAPMLNDTFCFFVFGYGAGNPNDTATCQVGAYLGMRYHNQDSLIPRIINWVMPVGTSGDIVEIGIFGDSDGDFSSPEDTILAATSLAYDDSPGVIVLFDKIAEPQNRWIFAKITGITDETKKPEFLILDFGCSIKRYE